MKRRKLALSALVILVALIATSVFIAQYYSSNASGNPHKPSSVPITIDNVPQDLKIGVVETLSMDGSEGGGWSEAGQGVLVASYRLSLADTDVDLRVVNDYGTSDGATKAISDLKSQSVSGVIALTSGSHARILAEEAHKAGLPIIFPYEGNLPQQSGVWSFAADTGDNSWVNNTVKNVGAHRPVVITTDGASKWNGEAALTLSYSMGQDDTSFVEELLTAFESYSFDSVVVLGNPIASAHVVSLVQATGVTYPIVVSPTCRNPLFTSTLASQGLLSADIASIGVSDADIIALESSARGSQAAAFFTALRAMSEDPNVLTLEKDRPFGDVITQTDALSHDALVALVYAAAEAKSTDPAQVASSLEDLVLESTNSVINAPLDFSHSHVLDEDNYGLVRGTSDTTGLRGVTSETLIWFGEED